MTDTSKAAPSHPANTVFALMEDRSFRHAVVRPALEADKAGLCRLTTGKHQLKGFRNISRAPVSLIVPVISDEANLSPELAQRILQHWFDTQDEVREKVSAKLKELGYTPKETPFDEDGGLQWDTLKADHADEQFDGTFLESEDHNAVMLMSLLLGWFGADDEGGEEEETED